jgi:hypothetical protein
VYATLIAVLELMWVISHMLSVIHDVMILIERMARAAERRPLTHLLIFTLIFLMANLFLGTLFAAWSFARDFALALRRYLLRDRY